MKSKLFTGLLGKHSNSGKTATKASLRSRNFLKKSTKLVASNKTEKDKSALQRPLGEQKHVNPRLSQNVARTNSKVKSKLGRKAISTASDISIKKVTYSSSEDELEHDSKVSENHVGLASR